VSRPRSTPAGPKAIDLDARRARLLAAGGIWISGEEPATVRSAELERLGLELQVEFGYDRGRSQITAVHVRAAQGVTVSLLRALPLGDVERQRDRELAGLQRTARRAVKKLGGDPLAELQELLARLPEPNRRRGGTRLYELVAAIYSAQVNAGVRTPSVVIASATGCPLPTVQGWVRRARLRGLLPPARRGAAG